MDNKMKFTIGICNKILQMDTADQNAWNSESKATHYLKNYEHISASR